MQTASYIRRAFVRSMAACVLQWQVGACAVRACAARAGAVQTQSRGRLRRHAQVLGGAVCVVVVNRCVVKV